MPCLAIPNNSFLTSTIIVLNKCDLLQAKLQRGVRIRDSVPSFGERNNDLQTATQCKHINYNKKLRFTHQLNPSVRLPTTLQGCSAALLAGQTAPLCSPHFCHSAFCFLLCVYSASFLSWLNDGCTGVFFSDRTQNLRRRR